MSYEEEMMLKAKQEKREKVDIMIAYGLIVILLICIFVILYLKFIKKEDKVEEYTPVYASISDVATNLNNSSLNISATTSDNSIIVTNSDNSLNLTIPLLNNELVVTYNSSNEEIVTSIYKEITEDLCMFYNNNANACNEVVGTITKDSNINGIRFTTDGDNTKVYINLLSSIDIMNR